MKMIMSRVRISLHCVPVGQIQFVIALAKGLATDRQAVTRTNGDRFIWSYDALGVHQFIHTFVYWRNSYQYTFYSIFHSFL